ncbi:MAG: hypothetical protein IT374_07955 [Polyangiaceae bacterium]|nr:hypothetical protein [Polyangiaceae bacterium]
MRRTFLSILLVATTLSAAYPVAAAPSDADKAQARQLTQQGLDQLAKQDFSGAFQSFTKANKLYSAPTVELGLARSAVKVGRLVLAQEVYQRLSREQLPPGSPAAFVDAVRVAAKELAELAPRVPALTVQIVKPAGAKEPRVTVDGEPLSSAALGSPRPIDPGPHKVRAEADGMQAAEAEVIVAEGKRDASVTLTLQPLSGATPVAAPPAASPPPAAPPEPAPASKGKTHPGAYVGLGVGAVGVLVGAVFGLKAMGKKSDLNGACVDGKCPPSAEGTHDSFKSAATLSTIGFAVGVVGLGAGTYFLVNGSTKGTGASAGVGGTF